MPEKDTQHFHLSRYRTLGEYWRPGDPIRDIACTDSFLIVSTIGGNTDLDRALTLLDSGSGSLLLPRLMHGAGMPRSMNTCRGATYLASGANDGVVRIWSLTSLRESPEVEISFDGPVQGIALADDQKFGCVLIGRNIIDGWDFACSRRRYRISDFEGHVSSIACCFDRDLLLAVIPPNKIEIFAASSGAFLARHEFSDIRSHVCCFAPKGKRWLLVGADHTEQSILFELNATDGALSICETSRLDCHSCAAFSPSGDLIASTGLDPRDISVLDATNGRLLQTAKGHTDRVRAIAFSPQGESLYTGGNDRVISRWRVHDLALDTKDVGPQHRVVSVRYSPRENEGLAVATGDGTVTFWQTLDEEVVVLKQDTVDAFIQVFEWGPDANSWVAGGRDLTLICTANSKQTYATGAAALSSGGKDWWIYTANDNSTVRLWDTHHQKIDSIDITALGEGRITSIVSLPSSKSMCFVATDLGTVLAVNCDDGSIGAVTRDYSSPIARLILSSDEASIYCASRDGSIAVLDTSTLKVRHRIQAHSSWINDLAISPDGRYLASASHDSTVAVWDLSTLSLQARVSGHCGVVRSVSFSPNGEQLASGGDDARVIIWSVTPMRNCS